MSEPTKRTWATIDLDALRKNLALVRARCPESKIFPVIKSNAYGHGMERAARAILESHTKIAGFAVATVREAIELHALELGQPVLLLNGFVNEDELMLCLEKDIEPVIHSTYQVELAIKVLAGDFFSGKRKFWIKMNTGMNRLGMDTLDTCDSYLRLHAFPDVELVLMSHLAYADDMDNPDSKAFTKKQMEKFSAVRNQIQASCEAEVECSMAASAGILTLPDTHLNYVRPGVMLYGSSPLAQQTGEELGLHPVMTLSSRLIAINEVSAGETIGYNATYTCAKDTRVGVVSIGYGDGYPRSAVNGTPVLVKTESQVMRTQLIGRVSMDMITIDLTGIDDAQINDEIILWGCGLCPDEVASHAGTISYELFCKVTGRVPFIYQ
ncbi:MAG: alanine racemase [Gammaproteobacteria bacterium]|nr:alanine racemase [Gammaproteobacteria bacterium]MDD9897354.1 alanine racemase [Gammaproteobacteria bacterium]MDD9959952.1 alanine racemase [Gammaproteobacteria bacterium]